MKIILVDAINTFVIKEEGIFKEMHDLLEEYSNEKIILTNADDKQIKEHGLDQLPYKLFTLKHNPNKTDPEYYIKLLEKFNLTPDDVIYFEHNKDAIESAKSVGIKTYYYDPEKKDLNSLKEFLNNNS
ncbi:MAG: HAD-IA family hydrolase [Candidatus Paceibacterota bacterium]